MKNIIIKLAAVCLLPALCFTLGACSKGADVSLQPSADKQAETVIVKETVYVTEPSANSAEQDISSEIETQPETVAEKKGFTTKEVLQKAESASENQYWIVFFGEGSLQMATFNALENFTVKWTSGGELVCDKLMGVSTVKHWDSGKSTFTGKEGRTDVAFRASEIVGSNCDIYDEKNDTVIKAKTE